MNPDKFGVVIIQFLSDSDKKTGESLYENTLKYKQFEKENLSRNFYDVHTKSEFLATLKLLIERIKEENYYFILHIETHGNRDFGLGSCFEEIVSWDEFFFYSRQMNILFDGTLLLIMAMCHGNSMVRAIKLNLRSPFICLIGTFREVNEDYIERGFETFYEKFFFQFNIGNALEAMNDEIDCNPPFFWLTTAEYCFDNISSPNHDSSIFWNLLCPEVNEYYSNNKKTELSLSEVCTQIDAYLQEEFRKAQRHKDHFLFKDKQKEQSIKK